MAGLSLASITETYFYDFEDREVINSGWCFCWAWLAHLKTGGTLCTYDGGIGWTLGVRGLVEIRGSHAFIKVGERFYDSSRPRGVTQIKRLSFFEGVRLRQSDVLPQSPAAFKTWWIRHGRTDAWSTQNLVEWPKKLPDRPELPL